MLKILDTTGAMAFFMSVTNEICFPLLYNAQFVPVLFLKQCFLAMSTQQLYDRFMTQHKDFVDDILNERGGVIETDASDNERTYGYANANEFVTSNEVFF